MPYKLVVALALLAGLLVSPAEARHHHQGACDGFHRCRCGTTAAARHGLPLNYHGYNLKMAREYGRAFPHTSFHIGALGVVSHHVLTIVGGDHCSRATVYDDAGTYQRNVCGMTFVEVGGSDYSAATIHDQTGPRHIARGIRHQESDRAFHFFEPGKPLHGDLG